MQYALKLDLENGWKGTVTLTVPPHHSRSVELQKARTTQLMDSKKLKALKDEGERHEASTKNTEILAAVYEFARKRIESVELEGPKGEKCTTLEAFETHPDLSQGWVSVAVKYSVGFGPEKTKSP